jgi:hypothetical protein
MGEERNVYRIMVGIPNVRDKLEGLSVHGRTLKSILKKENGMA